MGLEYPNMFVNDEHGVHTMKLVALEFWWALSKHIHMKFNLFFIFWLMFLLNWEFQCEMVNI
jgi:hypothetical protein